MLARDLVDQLSGDNLSDINLVCREFEESHPTTNLEEFEDEAVNFLGLLHALLEKSERTEFNSISIIELTGNAYENVDNIKAFFDFVENIVRGIFLNETFLKTTQEFSSIVKEEFLYSFSESEIERIQQLINELRDLIANSEILEGGHISRLLRRLEKLQSELHKQVSDLDRFWGLVGDAGIAVRKFGEDAKPLVDRIKEIAEIVWKAQQNSEGIEDGSRLPLLGGNAEE